MEAYPLARRQAFWAVGQLSKGHRRAHAKPASTDSKAPACAPHDRWLARCSDTSGCNRRRCYVGSTNLVSTRTWSLQGRNRRRVSLGSCARAISSYCPADEGAADRCWSRRSPVERRWSPRGAVDLRRSLLASSACWRRLMTTNALAAGPEPVLDNRTAYDPARLRDYVLSRFSWECLAEQYLAVFDRRCRDRV